MKLRIWAAVLGIGALLVAIGVALATNNPTIGHTDVGTYQCLSPYDTIVFGDRNNVGMHSDAQDIEHRCYQANRNRFASACAIAGLGTVIGAVGATNLVRTRRATRRRTLMTLSG